MHIFAPLMLTVAALASPWNIMPLGDSITAGGRDRDSYRRPLYFALSEAEVPFDFVGSVSSARLPHPDFDLDHEGHDGHTMSQIRSSVPGWAEQSNPDIVLLLLGSNDMSDGVTPAGIAAGLQGIIETLQAVNPRVVVLLGSTVPNIYRDTKAVVAAQQAMVPIADTPESPVVYVDLTTGFDPYVMTVDGLHPNAEGDNHLAAAWLDALLWLPYRLADIYRDGRIDAADVQVVINTALGRSEWTSADVDRDGTCNAQDVQRVINAALGAARL